MKIFICENCNTPINYKAIVINGSIIHECCEKEFERKLKGLIYKCPKCKTIGIIPTGKFKKINKEVNIKDNRGIPTCVYNDCRGCKECKTGFGLREVEEEIQINCDLCLGKGWLNSEPKPILGITGWKLLK